MTTIETKGQKRGKGAQGRVKARPGARVSSKAVKVTRAQREAVQRVKDAERQIAAAQRMIAAAQKQIANALKQITKDKRKATRAVRETKTQAKQVVKTTRAAAKLVKAIKSIVIPPKKKPTKKKSITLDDYERILGEDFESLAQAKRAYQRETKQKGAKRKAPEQLKRTQSEASAKVLPKVNKRKRIYTIRELPEAKQNSILNGTLEDLREASPMYDDLLKPGEIWGFKFGKNSSYATYDSFGLLINHLSEYKTVEDYGDDESAYDDLSETIKIIRFKAPHSNNKEDAKKAWQARKTKEVDKRKQRAIMYDNRRKERKRQKRVLQQDVKRQLKASKAAKIAEEKAHKEAMKANQAMLWERAQRKSLQRKLERLEAREVERIHASLKRERGKK